MVTRPRPPSSAPSQPPPGHQAQPDKDTTRERLLLAALRLFAQQGYARTSVRAIAQEAGANVAAIAYPLAIKQRSTPPRFTSPWAAART